jgi:flagellar protein FliL
MALGKKKKAKADAAETTEAAEAEGAPAPAKRSKGSIAVPIACLAVGALLGPKVLGTQGAAGAAAAPAAPVEQEVELGEVVVLDPVTVNLADGRVLKVGVALQLTAEAKHAKAEKDDPTKGYAPALDAVLDTLGRHSMAELVEPDGRDRAKVALVERLEELTHGDVVDVYFHQFVMA